MKFRSIHAVRGVSRRKVLAAAAASLPLLGMSRALRAAPEKVDVAVVGGGLAGMYAAMLLNDLGASVLVLEGDSRPGGRCRTTDSWGSPVDLGASQIGGTYGRIHSVCDRLGIARAPGAHMNAPYTPVIGGRMIPAKEWPDSKYNKTVGGERAILPHALFGYYVGQRTPLESLTEWRSPAAAEYDMSVEAWLLAQGASEEARRLMYEALGRVSLAEKSVLRMLQEVTRGRVEMDRISAEQKKNLDQYEVAALLSSHVVGGTSRLTDAMAEELGDRLRLSSKVTSITQNSESCRVTLESGATVDAGFVLAATPFSTLRKIRFDPPLSGAQAEAVAEMPYNNQSQVWMGVKAPYWEDDGLDASLWTDGPLQYVRQQIEPNGSRIMMSAITSGQKARFMDSLTPAQRGQFALDEIARIRPSTSGKLELLGTHSWNDGPTAGGCSFELPTGRALKWITTMGEPHGRVHFAGEHLRVVELGMEAAMETGERAAIAIAERSLV
ncbi:MAG: monoamine oxidase [Halieaceae bacterium]|jgi:monoamine oxidase